MFIIGFFGVWPTVYHLDLFSGCLFIDSGFSLELLAGVVSWNVARSVIMGYMSVNVSFIEWASEQATSLLSPLGSRRLHVQRVVKRAYWIGQTFDGADRISLLAAAYLHDIGYAPSLRMTGFHPLDGALYLRSFGYERLASIVAHHFAARFEAHLRECDRLLQAFPRERSVVADALTYCDATTGPAGELVSLKERARELVS
jgi:hypothetical protein